MGEATFTFRVDEELKTRFVDAAKAHDRTGAQLLRDFMRDYVHRQEEEIAYDAWFRRQVDEAIEEADSPDAEWVTHEEVLQDMARQCAELTKRIENDK